MPLTERRIAALPPGRHHDGRGDGLCLLVRPAGRRLWIQRLSVGGKVREMGHGAYPAVTLAEARKRARAAKVGADAGQDPLAERKAAKADAQPPATVAAGRTLRDALEAYLGAHAPGWRSSKTEKLTRAMLERYAAILLDRQAAEIGLEDVRAVLAPLWGPKLETATKLRTRLEGVLEYAIAAGWRPGPNPAVWRGGLRPLLARPDAIRQTRHHPALPWEHVPGFVAALGRERGNAARALHLAVLTACRSGEIRGADWSEIDLEARLWTIPARRMKSGRDHRVPLSPPVLGLLRSMLPEDGARPAEGLLFPNTRAAKPFSDMALLAVVKRMDAAARRAGGAGWRDSRGERIAPHGFRAAFRSWCGDHGHDRDLAEMALAHTVGDETERAYARSDLLARRRTLMDAWSEHCARESVAERMPAPGAAVVRMVA